MPSTFLRPLFLLLALSPALWPAQDTSPPTERQSRARQATEQRLAHAASAEYNPYETGSREFQKAADAFLAKDDFAQAIATAQKGLTESKYNIELLIILASAYRAAGDIPHADQTRQQWISLVDSVLSSGDGRDFKSAFQVISVAEEYSVLRILGYEVLGQTLQEHEGSEFDAMQVKEPKSGNEFTLYFNVDLPKKWLARQLSATK